MNRGLHLTSKEKKTKKIGVLTGGQPEADKGSLLPISSPSFATLIAECVLPLEISCWKQASRCQMLWWAARCINNYGQCHIHLCTDKLGLCW